MLHVPGDLGDIRGLVADALHVGDHPQGGRHRSQVPGHRLLAQQKLHALPLDIPLLVVNLLFQAAGLPAQLLIVFQKRLGGHRNGLLTQRAQLNQFHVQLLQLFVKAVSHAQPNLPVI